jgi:uncharacterized membrane protein YqjE
MTNETGNSPAGSAPSLKRFGAAALGLLSGHVELLGAELQEQKIYGLRTLVWTGLVMMAGLLLVIGLSALLLVALWDDYRLHAIIGLCVFYAMVLLVCLWRLRITLKASSKPFSATRAELVRSREQLLP